MDVRTKFGEFRRSRGFREFDHLLAQRLRELGYG
jgi:hypothetical protein